MRILTTTWKFIRGLLIGLWIVITVMLVLAVGSMRVQLDQYDEILGKMLLLHRMEIDRLNRLDGGKFQLPVPPPPPPSGAPSKKELPKSELRIAV